LRPKDISCLLHVTRANPFRPFQPVELLRAVPVVFGDRVARRRHHGPVLRPDTVPDHGLGYQ